MISVVTRAGVNKEHSEDAVLCGAQVIVSKSCEINILRASIEGMNVAAANLKVVPQFLAIDGNRFISHNGLPYKCIVKGDGKYANIAAASVLAKTHRDEYMLRLHDEYPNYGWDRNKGYPTKEQRMAIREYGLTPYHRLSFNHTEGQLELF